MTHRYEAGIAGRELIDITDQSVTKSIFDSANNSIDRTVACYTLKFVILNYVFVYTYNMLGGDSTTSSAFSTLSDEISGGL